ETWLQGEFSVHCQLRGVSYIDSAALGEHQESRDLRARFQWAGCGSFEELKSVLLIPPRVQRVLRVRADLQCLDAAIEDGDAHRPMLVHVPRFVEDPEGVTLIPPSECVRLELFESGPCALVDPPEF